MKKTAITKLHILSKLKIAANNLKVSFQIVFFFLLLAIYILIIPSKTLAMVEIEGKDIFSNHCSGCHINGGNIIRRGKTLKLKDLQRNGIDNPEAIAKIASNGIGIMDGYAEVLGKGGDEIVANWIWEQSQNAWFQG